MSHQNTHQIRADTLHEQVHKTLLTRIEAGEWEPKAPMPGEALLSQEFGVSVGTVRKAMDRLMRENIVVRERGRGTFVRMGAEWRSRSAFRLRDASGSPLSPEIRVVGWQTDAGPGLASRASSRRGSAARPRPLRLVREWRAGSSMVCIETIMVAQDRFPGLNQTSDLSAETLFSIYEESYRVKMHTIGWEIASCGPAAAPPGAEGLERPTVLLKRTAYDQKACIIEVCEQLVSLANRSVEIMR